MPNISQNKTPVQATNVAPIFAALGDDKRLMIVSRLRHEPDQSISKLTQGFSLTRQGVSRHLRVLEEAGLVGRRRVGRETRYHLEAEALSRARGYLERASGQWDAALDRLTKHVEG